MKKFIVIICVLLLTMTVQSQEILFGAKAGVNFASVGSNDMDHVEGVTSFHIGGLMEIPLNEKFAIQPELLYSSQGAKVEQTESRQDISVTVNSKIKLDYINVPIMAKYYIAEGFALEAGPQIGFLISAKAQTNGEIVGDLPPEIIEIIEEEWKSRDGDIKDDCQTLDFGVGAGASYRLKMGVFFGLRYNLGFSNIYKDDTRGLKNKNSVLQISAGYTF